ncbi:MAG: CocE/NonD family hydrolase [Pseudolabrys sp.]
MHTPVDPNDPQHRREIRDGMRIDWDAPIPMEDGVVLRCDIFRPVEDGRYPVIMTHGPYSKWKHFDDLYPQAYRKLHADHPEVPAGSTNKYQVWETVDPEKWVPDGYAVVRVDSRGAGRSPGQLDIWSLREAMDYKNCIEWAGAQPWSTGKVGLNGVSYYGTNQWQAAALDPKHLTAICVWEGCADFYRDMAYHGGILCNGFVDALAPVQIYSVQHGKGKKGPKSRITGDWISGPPTLSEEELGAKRRNFAMDVRKAKLATDEFWTTRSPDWSKVKVPLLSAANWGGQGLHPRGNFEGFTQAASNNKWLDAHPLEHWTTFYTDYGLKMQKKFFAYHLKGEGNWPDEPKVRLQIRHPGDRFVERHEKEWPLARTQWTKFHLDAADFSLGTSAPARDGTTSYKGFSDGVTFLTQPLARDTEITGPVAAKLWVSTETADADLFLVLRAFSPDFKEVLFQGSNDPHTPLGLGWLRLSHRKLDKAKSLPYRPYHTHDEIQPAKPNEVYEVDVEIWPTCIVVPKGYRIGLTVRGKDYEYQGDPVVFGPFKPWAGVALFTHDDPGDRPAAVFGGNVTLHSGPQRPAHLLLPVIPAS